MKKISVFDDHQPTNLSYKVEEVLPALYQTYRQKELIVKREIVACYEEEGFSVNPLEQCKDTGVVHLSTWSCGPALNREEVIHMKHHFRHGLEFRFQLDSETEGGLRLLTIPEFVQLIQLESGKVEVFDAHGNNLAEGCPQPNFDKVPNKPFLVPIEDDHKPLQEPFEAYIGIYRPAGWGIDFPVCVHGRSIFCLNHVYKGFGDDLTRLSKSSIGPTVKGEDVMEAWETKGVYQIETFDGVSSLRPATPNEVLNLQYHANPHEFLNGVQEMMEEADQAYEAEQFEVVTEVVGKLKKAVEREPYWTKVAILKYATETSHHWL